MRTLQLLQEEVVDNSPATYGELSIGSKIIAFPSSGLNVDSLPQLKRLFEFEQELVSNGYDQLSKIGILDFPLLFGNDMVRSTRTRYSYLNQNRILSFIPYTEFFAATHNKIETQAETINHPLLRTLYDKSALTPNLSWRDKLDEVFTRLDNLTIGEKHDLLGAGYDLQIEANWWLPVSPPIIDASLSLDLSLEFNSLALDAVKLKTTQDIDFGYYFNIHHRALVTIQQAQTIADRITDMIEAEVLAHPPEDRPSVVVIKIINIEDMLGDVQKVRALRVLVETILDTTKNNGILFHFSRSNSLGLATIYKGSQFYSYPLNLNKTIRDTGGGRPPPIDTWRVYDFDIFNPIPFGDYIIKLQNNGNIIPLPGCNDIFGGSRSPQAIMARNSGVKFAELKEGLCGESMHTHITEIVTDFVTNNFQASRVGFITRCRTPNIRNYL